MQTSAKAAHADEASRAEMIAHGHGDFDVADGYDGDDDDADDNDDRDVRAAARSSRRRRRGADDRSFQATLSPKPSCGGEMHHRVSAALLRLMPRLFRPRRPSSSMNGG